MNTKTAFLVYRPVMDYEESLSPYFICETKREAEAAAQKMCEYAQQLADLMPEYTNEEEDTDNSEWIKVDEKRAEILRKAHWPFGVNLSADISGFYKLEFNPSCVSVMELAFIFALGIADDGKLIFSRKH